MLGEFLSYRKGTLYTPKKYPFVFGSVISQEEKKKKVLECGPLFVGWLYSILSKMGLQVKGGYSGGITGASWNF